MKINARYAFLFRNTMLFALANFSNKLIVFFLLPFYTAYLTTEEYAVIDLIATAQQLIFPIVTLDITEAVIRFCMEKNADKKSVFTVSALVTVVGNLLLAMGSAVTAKLVGNGTYILYFFLFSLLVSVNTLLSSFYRTIDKLNIITIASIASTLIVTVMNIVLIAVLGMGIHGYYISYICGNVVAIVFMLLAVNPGSYIGIMSLRDVKAQLTPMLKYALPLIPNAMFWWVNSGLDRFCLSAISGLSVAGMYAAANKIPAILSTVTTIFQQSWGLSVFRENESVSKQTFFDEVYKAYNLIILLVTVMLILLAKFISSILLSDAFFNAWVWVPWLLLSFYSNSLCSFVGTEFTAAKKTTWILMTTAASAMVNIGLNLLLIPRFTGLGAAAATCASYFVLLELRIWILKRLFGLQICNRQILYIHAVLLALILCVTQFTGTVAGLAAVACLLLLYFEEKKEIIFLTGKLTEFLKRR